MLEELETSKDDYCRPLSISKDQKLELHLKRKPNSCFVNNYYDVAIKTDIQPVLNEYNAVTCMCQIFSKTEDQCLQAINQGAKEAFENNMHHQNTMKTIAKEWFVQEAVYNVLPELKLRKIFPAVSSSLPEKRVQVLHSEKEVRNLQDDSPYIFKK